MLKLYTPTLIVIALWISAAAQAETTLYGSLRAGVRWTDPDVTPDFFIATDESSRFGIRGSEDLGDGLKAIYKIEYRSNLTAEPFTPTGRERWVGLEGGFGKFRIGTVYTPFYDVLGRLDVFNGDHIFFDQYSANSRERLGTAVIYTTPSSFQAVTGQIMGVFDGDNLRKVDFNGNGNTNDPGEQASKEHLDQYSLGVNVKFGGFGGGVAYLHDEGFDQDVFGAVATFDFAGASIGVMYQQGDYDDTGASNCFKLANAPGAGDSRYYAIEGQYTFGNNIVRGAWGRCDPDLLQEADEWALGFQHNLSKRTRLWAEYYSFDKASNSDITTQILSLGMRHDF
ncbi:MAG: porin [Gammaproteobacteria bacterium]